MGEYPAIDDLPVMDLIKLRHMLKAESYPEDVDFLKAVEAELARRTGKHGASDD